MKILFLISVISNITLMILYYKAKQKLKAFVIIEEALNSVSYGGVFPVKEYNPNDYDIVPQSEIDRLLTAVSTPKTSEKSFLDGTSSHENY